MSNAYNRKSLAPLFTLFLVAALCPWAGPGGKLPAILGALAAVAVDLRQRRENRYRYDYLTSPDAGGVVWWIPVWSLFTVIAAMYTVIAFIF